MAKYLETQSGVWRCVDPIEITAQNTGTRTTSTDGFRRNKPLMTWHLRFSSARNAITIDQGKGWVFLVDLFRSGAFEEGLDQREERDTSVGYAADAMCIHAKRRLDGFDIDTRQGSPIVPTATA
jgi:hypothetical protein